jgi:hypothetical protein
MKTKKQKLNEIPRLDKKTGLYRYPKDLRALPNLASYFPKVKIVVDSEQSKEQVLKAIEYIHYLECIDSDFMAVNAFMHLYLFPGSVEVDPNRDFDYGPHRDDIKPKKQKK